LCTAAIIANSSVMLFVVDVQSVDIKNDVAISVTMYLEPTFASDDDPAGEDH
jgi:hypothetical protein